MTRHVPKTLIAQGKTIITAHSGCEGTGPNSREHILAAIESGAEMIEVDVRGENGLLYLWHDLPEDVSACVTLREMFELVSPAEHLELNLDLKEDGLIDAIMALAAEYPLAGRIVFTGEYTEDRAHIQELGAERWRNMRPGFTMAEEVAAAAQDSTPFLNVHYSGITEEFDRTLRSYGCGFSAWTVDNEADIRKMLELGVGNLTTRKPVLAMQLRREIQGI